jgi:dihydroorotate dehydrogenase (NAD+) catalytic subunit
MADALDAGAPDLSVDLGRGLRLRSPLLAASGTFGYGFDAPLIERAALGAMISKGTTLVPRSGNRPVRIAETPSGMLNAIGLENPGVDHVVEIYAPRWAGWELPVIVNVAGESVEEYVACARRLSEAPGIAGLELNISCPNVEAGMQFGTDSRLAGELTAVVRAATHLPLLVKLTPNVTDLAVIARAVEHAGADCISAVNTFVGMRIDIHHRRPVLDRITGGLSGPAIRPLALRAVWEVAAAVAIPVVGVGGIETAEDALEFLLAGAAAVQLGTVNYVNPRAAAQIRDGIAAYLGSRGQTDLRSLGLRGEVSVHA